MTKAQIESKKKRLGTMGNLNSAMVLYDSAIVAKEHGNYKSAKSKLIQAIDKMSRSKSYQKGGKDGSVVALAYYQLGLISELDRDFLTAKDSYAKALRIRPRHTQASVRLVNILAKYGHIDLARVKAMDAVRNNPKDPRAHLLLSLLSKQKGEVELADKESREMSRLLSVEAQIIPKNNAKQKNVIRMVDYLNKSKQVVTPPVKKVVPVKPHDEVVEDDAIEEVPADQKTVPEPGASIAGEEKSDSKPKTESTSTQTPTSKPESTTTPSPVLFSKPESKESKTPKPKSNTEPEASLAPFKSKHFESVDN